MIEYGRKMGRIGGKYKDRQEMGKFYCKKIKMKKEKMKNKQLKLRKSPLQDLSSNLQHFQLLINKKIKK